MTAEDSLAVSMLLIFLISGLTLLTIFISMVRNAGKKDEIAELMAEAAKDDEAEELPKEKPAGMGGGEQAWEKDPDWWRK